MSGIDHSQSIEVRSRIAARDHKFSPANRTIGDSFLRRVAISERRHWFFIFTCVCCAVVAGSWCLIQTPKQYESVAGVHIQSLEPSRLGLGASGADMEAQAEFSRGEVVLSMALGSPQIQELPMLRGQHDPIQFLKDHLRIDSSASSDVLRLSLISDSPADARALLDAIVSAYVRASNTRALDNSQLAVSIEHSAETLPAAVWPRPLPFLLVSGLIGLLIGSALAALWDGASPRLLDALDASMTARAPMLGAVPRLPRNLSSVALRAQSILVNPSADLTEGWRRITRGLDSVFVDKFDKTILFTAAGESRGKTLLASNVAIAMAQAGQRVVLVDAHPDRSTIGEIFGTDDTTGLGDAIDGRVGLSEALKVTGLPQLEVLPLGASKGTWRQILNSQDFIDVLGDLSERFDRVLIDGGPAATDECRILGAYCDLAVLVAEARVGRRRELRFAAEGLRNVGARLAGIVWNHSPLQPPGKHHHSAPIHQKAVPATNHSKQVPAAFEQGSLERVASGFVSNP
jgi:succinoglycan biosynthesis transport protein ExoP